MRLFILLFFIFKVSINASVSFTNTTPNINEGENSIGNFNIEATMVSTSDLDLGSSFSFTLPDSLPSMSMDDIDDGKLFVSYKFFDANKSIYESAPGLRITISDRNVSIKITSVLFTLETRVNDVNKKIPLSKGDYIRFTFSASNDIKNIANAKYKDSSSIKFYSSDINIIDKSNTINTPSR